MGVSLFFVRVTGGMEMMPPSPPPNKNISQYFGPFNSEFSTDESS